MKLARGWSLDPVLLERFARFRANRRAFGSLLLLSILFFVSLFSEGVCNNRPFVVRYQGKLYFPIVRYYRPIEFGEHVLAQMDYRAWSHSASFAQGSGNWMIFPPIPYSPNESMELRSPPPTAPTSQNWLGTDDRGRDLLTRLIYGFRNSMLFGLVSWMLIVVVAFAFGATQGYLGGSVDFLGQRFVEIWHALPLLYVVIFLVSIFPPNLKLLTGVWVLFHWVPLSAYIRAEVLRLRKQEFILAAEALGASTPRILLRHILPNALTPILTFSPFLISGAIASLAALDYLGLGLPPPTSSWGELLRQGKENLHSWWLVLFPFLSLFGTLLLLNLIGDGVRQSFDAKENRG